MRVDAGVVDGSVVGVHYDPLLAKVIAHAPTRPEAARLLASALAGAHIHGLVTNRDLLVGILRSEAFLAGDTTTGFLDHHPPAELTAGGGSADPATIRAARRRRRARRPGRPPRRRPRLPGRPLRLAQQPLPAQQVDPEGRAGFGRPHGRLPLRPPGALETLVVDGDPLRGSRLWACTPDLVDLEVDGVRRRFEVHQVGDTSYVDSPLGHTEFHEHPQTSALGAHPPAPGAPAEGLWTAGSPDPGDRLRSPTGGPGAGSPGSRTPADPGVGTGGAMVSPLPGVVRRVAVRDGERVEAGAVLVVVEAMKTEHRIAAARAGTVRRVLVVEGQEVAAGTTVVELEEAADG